MERPMKYRLSCLVALVIGISLWAVPVHAQADLSHSFLICHTGSVATAEEAQPYIDGFGGYLAKQLGWKEGNWSVQFENKRTDGVKGLEAGPSAFATLSLGMVLEFGQKYGLKPLVLAKVNGKTTNRYRILVKKGTFKTLEDLKGKKLVGNLLDDPAFLSKIIFAGKIDAQTHFILKQSKRPLRAIRKVAKGKADAALVDDAQYASLKGLPLFSDLESIFESTPFPNVGMVATNSAKGKDIAVFKRALIKMCSEPEGKKMCETFAVEGFVDAPEDVLMELDKLYQ
jgi:ABC-type phosphate/phosphonate transport system substrate-binding protein